MVILYYNSVVIQGGHKAVFERLNNWKFSKRTWSKYIDKGREIFEIPFQLIVQIRQIMWITFWNLIEWNYHATPW